MPEKEYADLNAVKEAEEGESFLVKGVIAQFQYGYNGKVGAFIADESGTLYVYGGVDMFDDLEVGQTIEAEGSLTHYLSQQESGAGADIGWLGARQLTATSVTILDSEIRDFPIDSIEELRIRDIVNTDFRDRDLSATIFKVPATIVKVAETGFTNYYFFDLSMDQSVYCYSTMSGSDYSYLDQYDGESHWCYVGVQGLRPRDEAWRIIPCLIGEETDPLTIEDEATFALDRLEAQFLETYNQNATITLLSSDTKLEGATISYSANPSSFIEENDGVYSLIIDASETQDITVTISLNYQDNVYTREVTIHIEESQEYETITIAEALAAEEGSVVTIEGVYVRFAANVNALYLSDETGIITVNYASISIDDYTVGETMVFEGTVAKDFFIEGMYDGLNVLQNANLLSHDSNFTAWDKSIVAGDSTVSDLYQNASLDMIGKIYRVPGIIRLNQAAYYSNVRIVDPENGSYMNLYCDNASQLSWLDPYMDEAARTWYIYIRDSKNGSSLRIEALDFEEI